MSAVKRLSNDFPILKEARREVLEDKMDLPSAVKVLKAIEDGIIKAAISEVLFSRIKHDGGFPSKAIQSCLMEAGVRLSEVDKIAVGFGLISENVEQKSQHKFSCYARIDPRFRKTIFEEKRPIFYNHQYIHAKTGYSMSNFRKAVAISLDGSGIDDGRLVSRQFARRYHRRPDRR